MQQVNLDSLSLLPNRHAFDAALDDSWRAAERSRKPLALLLADVDFLAEINDRLGHEEGDQIICEVARVLEESEATVDAFVARYGGGEFAVLLIAAPAAAAAVAERLRGEVAAEGIPNPYSTLGKRVTISLGGASLVPAAGRSPAELVKAAEQGLVQAKQQGRNRVVQAG
jgi:two-component system chemotaxis family response regulator WspR